ncbi:MAG TPA: alanyl-tRNA editing protein [Candidatus Acidoferrales bacterium]|nr:alanyl-tRNA editing protein [Candidatus Acidoferrales bacterium]
MEPQPVSGASRTERLYYRDSFLAKFDAQVVSCIPAGECFRVVLDRTAFYPTSGGQPFDTGRLGDAAVVEVAEAESGEIVHTTDRAVPAGAVHGAVDWPRRFDHMQQHTGQHLLSAIFVSLFGYATVSFHLGREISAIDLAAPGIPPAQLAEAEQRVNEVIFEDRPVTIRFGTREEFTAAGVRKDVQREGLLRAIEIEGIELQPCGGTHVARTGQIGLMLLRKCEKQKGNWRVEFVCGGRALAAAREDRRLLVESARTLGGAAADVPALVARAAEERRQSDRQRKELQSRLAAYEARALWDEAAAGTDGVRVVRRVLEPAEPEYLRLLATRIVEQGRGVALLAARPGGHLVFAQAAGLAGDMNEVLRAALAGTGGKGGGTRDFSQGSCPDPTAAGRLEGILEAAAGRLSSNAAAG